MLGKRSSTDVTSSGPRAFSCCLGLLLPFPPWSIPSLSPPVSVSPHAFSTRLPSLVFPQMLPLPQNMPAPTSQTPTVLSKFSSATGPKVLFPHHVLSLGFSLYFTPAFYFGRAAKSISQIHPLIFPPIAYVFTPSSPFFQFLYPNLTIDSFSCQLGTNLVSPESNLN